MAKGINNVDVIRMKFVINRGHAIRFVNNVIEENNGGWSFLRVCVDMQTVRGSRASVRDKERPEGMERNSRERERERRGENY